MCSSEWTTHPCSSKLVSSETCQSCGECCKIFAMTIDSEVALRLKWMLGEKVSLKDVGLKTRVTFHVPCSRLEKRGDKYFCLAWNEKRPIFCVSFPDDRFHGLTSLKSIESVRKFYSKECPALKKLTARKIAKKLNLAVTNL